MKAGETPLLSSTTRIPVVVSGEPSDHVPRLVFSQLLDSAPAASFRARIGYGSDLCISSSDEPFRSVSSNARPLLLRSSRRVFVYLDRLSSCLHFA